MCYIQCTYSKTSLAIYVVSNVHIVYSSKTSLAIYVPVIFTMVSPWYGITMSLLLNRFINYGIAMHCYDDKKQYYFNYK